MAPRVHDMRDARANGPGNGDAVDGAVVVIILNWNNLPETRSCIESVLRSTAPRLTVVIVDNASTDGSAEELGRLFPSLPFVANERNLGFAGGVNAGLRFASAMPDARHFILMNNDCRVEPYSIANAVAEANSSASIGLVTPKILFDPQSRRFWHAGGSISVLHGRASTRGWGEIDVGQYDRAEDTGWASGALMLITRRAIERVGFLCEEYFFGLEEWDYSLLVRRAGLRIRYCPGFVGYHGGDGSHANYDPKYVYNYYRNKLIFQQRQLGQARFVIWLQFFRLYVRLGLRRQSIELARKHGTPIDERWLNAVHFAATCALEDHGTNALSPAVMQQFLRRLEAYESSMKA